MMDRAIAQTRLEAIIAKGQQTAARTMERVYDEVPRDYVARARREPSYL